jgi:hypothetical protein
MPAKPLAGAARSGTRGRPPRRVFRSAGSHCSMASGNSSLTSASCPTSQDYRTGTPQRNHPLRDATSPLTTRRGTLLAER